MTVQRTGVLEFEEVLSDLISLIREWTDTEVNKRLLACDLSAAALLPSVERDHIARLIVEARIMDEGELRDKLNAGKQMVPKALLPNLVDIVADDDGRPAYLLIENGMPVITHTAEDSGMPFEIYRPPLRKQMPWLLCRGENVLKHVSDRNGDLWEDIRSRLRVTSDLPSDNHYDLLTAWVAESWIYEMYKYAPYLWLYGIWERGKTRTCEALIHMSRRGVIVESAREAYLLRMADRYSCTFFFDVESLWGKAQQERSTDLFLTRFERGAVVARVLWPGRPAFEDMAYFAIYGPTIIATNEEVPEGLHSRAIQITMPESDKVFDRDFEAADWLQLKERLCAFRARIMMGGPIPEVDKMLNGRIGDICRPLHVITRYIRPDREAAVVDVMKHMAAERRTTRADSKEGRLLECVISLKAQVQDGCLENGKIMGRYKQMFPGYPLSEESMGKTLRAMGFKGVRSAHTRSIAYDEQLIDALRNRMDYGDARDLS